MPQSLRLFLAIMLACCCTGLTALAASFHVSVIHPAKAPGSSASRLVAKANANASEAAGSPYVNPNVAAGHRTTQDNASSNADAAEIRNAHVDVGPN